MKIDRLESGYAFVVLGVIALGIAHAVLEHGPTPDGARYFYAVTIHVLVALPAFIVAFVISMQERTHQVSHRGTLVLRALSLGVPVGTTIFYGFVLDVLY